MTQQKKIITFIAGGIALLVLPLLLQTFGNAWVRIADVALLYVLLALGLNIVVGYAGLLDLGYVAFFAIGAYMYGLLSSPQLTESFEFIAQNFPDGLHQPLWVIIPAGAGLAGLFGVLLGAPTLRLRGDYLAIVTLGFGEIIRVFLNNLDAPINICHRLELSRVGRAWMAIREDEIAAKAMGINTRNMKLLAFGMGATFGGVSGVMFGAFQGFISPESFTLMESVMIVAMVVLGGVGHLPGVILGAVLLSALPEVLRFVAGPLQAATGGRLDASILRQLLIALAMITIMLSRPRGLWPSPEHGKSLQTAKS
ncbi:MAG: ABC transporter ATP-binding protein [Rhodoferax sp.]|nr:ABC transporter ATP-binding protein [Rhodoferax sp.]